MTKILLVEDDKSLREIYGVRLLAEGYDIVSAGDGEEALAMAIKDRPALIVSDVMMPKISGFDMLDILRSTTETRDIKVIMMTALSSEDQRQRGESLGADRYLVKSQVGIEDVVRAVHDVLGDAPGSATTQPSAAQPVAPVSFRSGPQGAPAVAVPTRDSAQPTAAPAVPQPAPAPQPLPPAPAPVSAPAASPAQPAEPAATAAPAEPATLPQPTAPFSTPRPAGLGDRVIQPITTDQDTADDVADRMAKELSTAEPTPVVTPPPVPPIPAAPSAPAEPAPVPQPVAANVPMVGNVPPNLAGPPAAPAIGFEETPRPPAPGAPVPPPAL